MSNVAPQSKLDRGPGIAGVVAGVLVAAIWSQSGLSIGAVPLGPVLGFAVMIGVALLLTSFQRAARRNAFRMIYDSDDLQALLVDRRGRILETNAQIGPHTGTLSAFLQAGLPEADELIYALGRQAESAGEAESAITWNGQGARLSVRQLKGASQIWTIAEGRLAPAEEDDPARPVPEESSPQGALLAPGSELTDNLPVGLARVNRAGAITYLNKSGAALLGPRAAIGQPLAGLIEGLGREIPERLEETLAGKSQGRSEVARGSRDDAEFFLQVNMIRIHEGEDPEVLAVLSDATELKTLEAQFVQGQKMQAVGQLAGGIAHDFNNLLTAIHGHCDLLLLRHDHGDPDHGDLIQVRQNANRAAALVRQLLAFSRKQTMRLNVLHLYDTMSELAHLLNRLLGERVQLNLENLEAIWPVRVDERQLEQVVVNLVVNARDAMEDGGIVTLRTRNVELEQEIERDRAVVPAGRYSVIEVRDTGSGIPPNQLTKIFEPFYTTKRVGEGTGLGLSTAYGIIKQSGGFIFVESEIGKGTCFTIFLPVYEGDAQRVGDNQRQIEKAGIASDLTGRGVVLLVEDEAPVRSFAARALRMRGYDVLEADCGEAALALVEQEDTHVDLFVSDVVMPGIDGPSWVRKALALRPDVSTIFVSGYAEDAFKDGHEEIPRSSFLAKPFSLNDLTGRVREHMDRYSENRLH